MGPGLSDLALRNLLAAFASRAPTPGGGSACAAGAAIGVALLIKVVSIAGGAQHTLSGIQEQLIDAIDGDAAAYQHVMTARRQPKGTPAEQTLRAAALQLALRQATDVPLGVTRLSAEALLEAAALAPRVHRATIADAVAAVSLVRAGFEGSLVTVHANLGGLVDVGYVSKVRDECGRLAEREAQATQEIERVLRAR